MAKASDTAPVRTIADIARLAGVSKATVSRALNDSPLIAAETKERIRSIARQHDFRINAPARRLSMKRSRTIAFVTHPHHKECFSMSDLFGLEIMGGISSGLSAGGYDLLVVHVDPRDTGWARQYLDTGRADGFVLMTSSRKQAHIRTLLDVGAPFIVWGVPPPNAGYCSVSGDNVSGGRLAAEHLIVTGRRRTAFLGGPADDLEVRLRYEGYAAALREAGRDLEPTLVAYGDFTDTSGHSAMLQLLEQSPDLDAVFVNSDLMAVAAMEAIREQGRAVPDDVAVVGYDDLSIAARTNPPLTTVRQNVPQAGRLLAQNLIDYLETGVVTNVSMPVELVVRSSA